ncbi:MAG TPA: prepilin-type N-terminal cleavage/methylation domain-containing protein [Candidatus Angelobacter sp.]|jgi:prepilin-type N-terminal cleavage/methylation domain-containing protein
MKQNKKFGRRSIQGFTLVELMVAMVVLTVGVLGGMVMVILGMTRDNTNRMDTTATNAAQAVMEQIAAVPANNDTNVIVTDCVPTARTVTTQGSAGGTGATLLGDGSGNVDFAAAPVPNYQIPFTVCGNNGMQITYDVRWRITTLPSGGKLVVVAAGHPWTDNKSRGMAYIAPVTLRTIVGL